MTTTDSGRRIPKQARSRERFDHILTVAANLFSKKGYDATTTNEISRDADISIGSLYQYFDNKETIAAALAERYEERLREVTSDVLAASVIGLPTAEALDRMVDPIMDFHAENPAFRALWLGTDASDQLHKAVQGMDDEAMMRVHSLIVALLPDMPKRRSIMVAMVMLGALKSLLSFQSRTDSASQMKLATVEVKRMLTAYVLSMLAEYAEEE